MKNTGKKYEHFVANLQRAIIKAELITTQRNIEVELNKKIKDNCGIEREFDIYWEYELGGITNKTIIECKDYSKPVSVDKIDALIGKTRDIPDLKAVFATKKGYQSGAKKKAEQNKIDLLVVREQKDSDWFDESEKPVIKKLFLEMSIGHPAKIKNFTPIVDKDWIEKNTSIDTSRPISASARNDKILIEDLDESRTYSLLDLESELEPSSALKNKNGYYEITKKLKNAFIYSDGLKLKMLGYKVEYSMREPEKIFHEIDFAKELIGVVEYLQKGKKKSIFKNYVKDGVI